MTKDDIIRLREQADDWTVQHLQCVGEYHPDFHTVSDERFVALVAAAEREAILQMSADNWYKTQKDYDSAIRARGETK